MLYVKFKFLYIIILGLILTSLTILIIISKPIVVDNK